MRITSVKNTLKIQVLVPAFVLIIAVFASAAAFAAGSNLEQMLTSGTAVQYERAVLYDQTLGCEVARSLMPKGWQVIGQVQWSMQSKVAPAVYDFTIAAPDGSAKIGYISEASFAEPNSSRGGEGGFAFDVLAPVRKFTSPEDFAYQFLLPYEGISSAEMSNVQRPSGELAVLLEAERVRIQQERDQACALVNQASRSAGISYNATVGFSGASVDFRYIRNGTAYKARFLCIIRMDTTIHNVNNAYMRHQEAYPTWFLSVFHYVIAEERHFDKILDISRVFVESAIANKQWTDTLHQAILFICEQQIVQSSEWLDKVTKASQQRSKALSASMQRNYSYSSPGSSSMSDAMSRAMSGWTNVITDREYYDGPDGGYVSLDSRYSHTYSDGSGGYIQSQRPMELPYGWNEVSSIGTMPPRR